MIKAFLRIRRIAQKSVLVQLALGRLGRALKRSRTMWNAVELFHMYEAMNRKTAAETFTHRQICQPCQSLRITADMDGSLVGHDSPRKRVCKAFQSPAPFVPCFCPFSRSCVCILFSCHLSSATPADSMIALLLLELVIIHQYLRKLPPELHDACYLPNFCQHSSA